MSESSFHPPVTAGVPLPRGVDIYCHKCGYNLRGLVEGHRCPECSTLIRLDLPRTEWSRWRIILTSAITAIVLLLAIMNVLFTLHPDWAGRTDLQVASFFVRVWLVVGLATIALGVFVESRKGIPLLMWVSLWSALLVSVIGWILNGLVKFLHLMNE